MKDKDSNKLATQEEEAFNELKASIKTPFGLENRIIDELREKQLITNNNTTMVQKRNFIWIAATITALLCGFFIGQSVTFQEAQTKMNKYILLLYENENFHVKNEANLVGEYTQWAVNLSQKGNLDNAEKLANESTWLGNETTQNQQSRVTGYFVILADNYGDALAIAKTHPHAGYGGGIELRPIEKLD